MLVAKQNFKCPAKKYFKKEGVPAKIINVTATTFMGIVECSKCQKF